MQRPSAPICTLREGLQNQLSVNCKRVTCHDGSTKLQNLCLYQPAIISPRNSLITHHAINVDVAKERIVQMITSSYVVMQDFKDSLLELNFAIFK